MSQIAQRGAPSQASERRPPGRPWERRPPAGEWVNPDLCQWYKAAFGADTGFAGVTYHPLAGRRPAFPGPAGRPALRRSRRIARTVDPGPGVQASLTPRECSATKSAIFTPWSAATISAAFSPIMIDAAFVFPLTIFGMTLASATRNLSTPITRNRGSTTLPIRQVLVR